MPPAIIKAAILKAVNAIIGKNIHDKYMRLYQSKNSLYFTNGKQAYKIDQHSNNLKDMNIDNTLFTSDTLKPILQGISFSSDVVIAKLDDENLLVEANNGKHLVSLENDKHNRIISDIENIIGSMNKQEPDRVVSFGIEELESLIKVAKSLEMEAVTFGFPKEEVGFPREDGSNCSMIRVEFIECKKGSAIHATEIVGVIMPYVKYNK